MQPLQIFEVPPLTTVLTFYSYHFDTTIQRLREASPNVSHQLYAPARQKTELPFCARETRSGFSLRFTTALILLPPVLLSLL